MPKTDTSREQVQGTNLTVQPTKQANPVYRPIRAKNLLEARLTPRPQTYLVELRGRTALGVRMDVSLDFAQWLSVDFRLWCLARLKELLMTGVTTVRNDDEAIAYAMGVQQLAGENSVLKAANEALTPKARFADAVEASTQSCLIGELAKILRQNGVDIGQNRLFEWLRRNGYLCSRGDYYNQPTQRAVEMGLFEVKKTSITKPDGSVIVTSTTKVTGKGQIYFVNKFLKSA